MIFIGIDDTDIVETPGTNQLARVILKRLGAIARDSVIIRHQLFFDPRVPYTSHNGSASIQLPNASPADTEHLAETIRQVMLEWFVIGSDPGLCIASVASEEMKAFGQRCKSEVVAQSEARAIAERAGCYLEGLGGTEQGVIGALAAVGLIVGGEDGRVVHLSSWPYPDDAFSGPRSINEIYSRSVHQIKQLNSGKAVNGGPIDIGKHLRPSWRGGEIVLYVEAAPDSDSSVPWRAVKIP